MAGVTEQQGGAHSGRDVISVGPEASGKEKTLELETDCEGSQPLDSLFRQALHNDRRALDELFARYRAQLYKRALHVLGNAEDAEDALQDGLLSAFRHLGSFKGRAKFSTWLTRIVINAALMQLRRRRPSVMTPIDQQPSGRDELPWASRLAEPAPSPEEVYARKERLQILEHRLRSLPAPYARVLWLRDVEEMSTEQVAGSLSVPIGTVKSQLHRARLRLRAEAGEAQPAPRVLRRTRSKPMMRRSGQPIEITARVKQPAA